MKKRTLALLLILIIGSISLKNISFANIQIPVDEVTINDVYYVEGEDPLTGETIISPTMTVSWEDPDIWYGDVNAPDYHEPDLYEITVENLTKYTTDSFTAYHSSTIFDAKSFKVQEEANLETGSLYKVSVEPQHYHTVGEESYELAQVSGTAEYAYGITELNVEFVSSEDSIQVIWDDLGSVEFEYRIVYALGDYTSSSYDDLKNNMEGEITGLYFNSEGVEAFYDSTENKNKLAYTISENIYPGQIYSIVVEPLVDYYEGEYVMRNRNYPYIRSTSTDVQLTLEEDGDYLRLEWEIPKNFQVGQSQDEYQLVEATLVEYNDGVSSNVVIFDGVAAIIGYYKVAKPADTTQYRIFFVYDAVDDESKASIEPKSNMVTYDPSDILITPTSPIVPNLFSENLLADLQENMTDDDIRDELEEKYLVPGNTYNEDIDDILDTNVTFHIIDEENTINFVFGAFERKDVDEESETYGQYIYDNNIYYTIWVTNDLDTLGYAIPIQENKMYTASSTPTNVIYEGNEICGYSQQIEQYYDDETGQLEDLVEDDIYYIKIVATNITSDENLTSDATITSLYYTYGGDAYQPPTISKPPLRVDEDETTETGVTLMWKEKWYEIISPDAVSPSALHTWETEVWVDEAGNVYNEEIEGAEYFPIYDDISEITRFENYLEFLGVDMDIIQRTVDLGEDAFGVSDVEYMFEYIEYSEVQTKITNKQDLYEDYSFTDYYIDLIEGDQNGTAPIAWNEISVETIDDYIYYRQDELLPNTSYLFMVYPYRVLKSGEILYAQYPTPIIVSTDPEETDVVPDPTVPTLYVTDSTDMTIDLTWKYGLEFEYKLIYSLYEDIETAQPVEWELEVEGEEGYPVDGEYYDMTVEGLFPETEYYFWIQTMQPEDGTVSAWSNAALGKTDVVDYPMAPRGLGIASDENMRLHDYDESVTDEYITFEWILDDNDDYGQEDTDGEDEEGNVTKDYSYIIEVADNKNFIDPDYIVSSNGISDIIPNNVTILEKNLVMISDLIPNRDYYIRAKTRVTVTGTEDDQVIIKDSVGYSTIIKLSTESTSDEYDGEVDPSLEVLPADDYELIYDIEEMSLEFRFYDGSEGENSVVQRVISKIVEDNVYNYEIDVSNFEGKGIKERKISIPYDIMEVFNDYQVSMTILADDLELMIPHGAIESELEAQVANFGVAPQVVIEIETLDAFYLEEQMPDMAITTASMPKDVEIKIVSDKKTTGLNYSDKEMTVNLKTNNRYSLYGMDSAVYTKNYKEDWSETEATFDAYNSNMTFTTAKVGAYGAYIVEGNDYITNDSYHWSKPYREAVFEAYNVIGLDHYSPDDTPSESEIINVVYNYVIDSRDIDVDQYVSTDVINTLYHAGIKTNTSKDNDSLSREETISMLTRAYEIKNDVMIEWDYNTYMHVDEDSLVDDIYVGNLAKAAMINLLTDTSAIRADDPITYGELFALWSKLE